VAIDCHQWQLIVTSGNWLKLRIASKHVFQVEQPPIFITLRRQLLPTCQSSLSSDVHVELVLNIIMTWEKTNQKHRMFTPKKATTKNKKQSLESETNHKTTEHSLHAQLHSVKNVSKNAPHQGPAITKSGKNRMFSTVLSALFTPQFWVHTGAKQG